MNTGIYIRVGKENKLLEEMTIEERHQWLNEFNNQESLIRCIDRLCEVELALQNRIQDLEDKLLWQEEHV